MTKEPRSIPEFVDLLKARYREHATIDRLFYPDNPLPLENCYLHLALIEEKEVKKGLEEQTKGNAAETADREFFLHQYERIERIQEKLEVKEILGKCQQIPKRIYIEGAAGAGKSTLSRFIVNEWVNKKAPWKDTYQWVFYLRLRELTNSKYTEKVSLIQMIEKKCFQFGHSNALHEGEKNLIENNMRNAAQKVLFVLDGYDELQRSTNYINDVWCSIINSGYDLILTSRPGAYRVNSELKINLNLAVLGFSNEQVEKYVNNFFSPAYTPDTKPEEGTSCLSTLKNNSNLWSLAHTPIQLELLCSIWGEELKQANLVITELYQLMLEKLLKRYEQLQLAQKGEKLALDDIDSKPLKKQTYSSHLAYMAYLAFLGMQAKVIILQEKEMNEAYNYLKVNVKQADFYKQLKGLGFIKRYNRGKQAEFVHLTFQEFFAARFVAKAIKAFCAGKVEGLKHDDLLKFISTTKWDPFYEVMWWFVAGLLSGHQKPKKPKKPNDDLKPYLRLQRLQTFFDLLLQEPRANVGFQEITLLTRCLDEAGMPEVMQKEAIILHIQKWYAFYLQNKIAYSLEISPLQHIESIVLASPKILRETSVFSLLINALKDDKVYVRIDAAKTLSQLAPTPADVTATLLERLRNEQDGYVIRKLVEALSKLSLTPAEVTATLLERLRNEKDTYVITELVEALSHLSPLLPAVEKGLLERLRTEQNEDVIRELVRALSKLSPTPPDDVTAVLLGRLRDVQIEQDKHVIFALVEALSKLSPMPPEVTAVLLGRLGNEENEYIRFALVWALSKLSSTPQEMKEGLLKRLGNEKNEHVISKLVEALSHLSPMPKEVEKALLERLRTEKDTYVIRELVEALSKLSPMPPEVTAVLLGRLGNEENEYIRFALVWALSKLSSTPQEMKEGLLKRLGNEKNEHVIRELVEALSHLSPMPKEVEKALLERLRTEKDTYVIRKLVEALSKLSPMPPEVTAVLLGRLGNEENEYIRFALVRALSKLSPMPKEVTATLLERLRNEQNEDVISTLVRALSKLSPMPPEVMEALLSKNVINFAAPYLCRLGQVYPEVLLKVVNEIFPTQPQRIPPSRLLTSSKEVVKVDDKGCLINSFKLCGEIIESMIQIEGSHLLTEDQWFIAIVRKKPSENTSHQNASPTFFTPVVSSPLRFFNGLFDHAALILEGVKDGVRFVKKIDLSAVGGHASQTSGQRIDIDVTDISDFVRFQKFAENCYCNGRGISKAKAEQLLKNVERDKQAAQSGEIIYNLRGDGSFLASNRDKRAHSCISWCLEKWQEVGLPLNKKWYDAIVVVPKFYIKENRQENESGACLTM